MTISGYFLNNSNDYSIVHLRLQNTESGSVAYTEKCSEVTATRVSCKIDEKIAEGATDIFGYVIVSLVELDTATGLEVFKLSDSVTLQAVLLPLPTLSVLQD